MTLGQALALVKATTPASQRRKIFLACGFQPLHLVPLLQGHFTERFPHGAADILTATYGNLIGALGAAAASGAEASAVIIEWSDLDPRLGHRSAGGWALSLQPDILDVCRNRFAMLFQALEGLAAIMPVALVPPTLSASPLGHTPGWQSSLAELELHSLSAAFLAQAAKLSRVYILHAAALHRTSPEPSRHDASLELNAGFPYTIPHASAVASHIIHLLFPPTPMKGLITDLDETLWAGIVGEVGPRGVTWDLSERTQIHGLYQQMLRHLSEMGVLLAIASKNEPVVVDQALERDDLLVPGKSFFPVCVNWGPKSVSVAEILRIWNIGPDGVAFVDDSAMELDEVRTAFPTMACLQFPSRKKPAQTLALLEQLRDLFGKSSVEREDALRMNSIRSNAAMQTAIQGSSDTAFVRSLQARLTFDSRKDPSNKRMLELVNKTNQFNLNGVRIAEGEWIRLMADPSSFVLSVSYEDKFGPLGVIAVVAGKLLSYHLEVSTWVMSCRAFSRRIEFHTLHHLFQSHAAEKISLCWKPTDRNEPLQQFLQVFTSNSLGSDSSAEPLLLSRAQFERGQHDLPHSVIVIEDPLLTKTPLASQSPTTLSF